MAHVAPAGNLFCLLYLFFLRSHIKKERDGGILDTTMRKGNIDSEPIIGRVGCGDGGGGGGGLSWEWKPLGEH